LASDQKDLLIS
jgi:chromosome segregation ATPase